MAVCIHGAVDSLPPAAFDLRKAARVCKYLGVALMAQSETPEDASGKLGSEWPGRAMLGAPA